MLIFASPQPGMESGLPDVHAIAMTSVLAETLRQLTWVREQKV
jgi:hypothetical protein